MFSEDQLTPPESMSRIDKLQELRSYGGARVTEGLTDALIAQFLDSVSYTHLTLPTKWWV